MELIKNQFTTYELTEEEAFASTNFNALQIAGFKNQLAEVLKERIALNVNVTTPEAMTAFIQQEAELKGEIRLLSRIIELSNTQEKPQ